MAPLIWASKVKTLGGIPVFTSNTNGIRSVCHLDDTYFFPLIQFLTCFCYSLGQWRCTNCSYYSWACRQSIFRSRLHANEAYGSIQWKMAHYPCLCVKTADKCNISHSIFFRFEWANLSEGFSSSPVLKFLSVLKFTPSFTITGCGALP